jgi:kumamolisin
MSFSDSEQQARVQLASSEHPQPSTTPPSTPIDPQKLLSVSVITRRRNPLSLAALGGRVLSHEEFEQQYGGDPSDFDALRTFAGEHGLTVNEERSSLARRTLVLEGTAAQMEQAFSVTLQRFEPAESGTSYHSYAGMVSVPQQQAPMIESVLGLDSRPIAKSHLRRRDKRDDAAGTIRANAAGSGFSPLQVAELYGFPQNLNGADQTIGILELGGGYETSDITSFFAGLGLTPPAVVAVSVDGGTNVPGGDPNGADGEVALDIQVAGAVANGAKIAVYFTPNTDQGFIDAITTAVHDTTNKPSVLSISWGGPETGWSAASRTSLDNACQSAAALGVTITVAAGDNGATDGQSGNTVDFPASSPHVLACGGTALAGDGRTITSEVVWNDLADGGGATGGGVSVEFALPSWQKGAGVPAPSGAGGGRGVPDVSGDASPETGYSILIDGQQEVVGGTSAVAPLWAGLIALVNQARAQAGQSPKGFLNPQLYAAPSALRDITSGSNGAYKAGKGWDACTGLGSPNGAAVLAALQQ